MELWGAERGLLFVSQFPFLSYCSLSSVSSDQCRAHTAVSPPANQHPSQFQLNSSRLYSLIHSPKVAWDHTLGLTKLFCSSALQPHSPEPQVSSKSTLLPSFLCCPTCVSHSPWPKQSPLTSPSLLQAPLPLSKGPVLTNGIDTPCPGGHQVATLLVNGSLADFTPCQHRSHYGDTAQPDPHLRVVSGAERPGRSQQSFLTYPLTNAGFWPSACFSSGLSVFSFVSTA